MSWQGQFPQGSGPYGGNGDPYMHAAWGGSVPAGEGTDVHNNDEHFLSSGTTRDHEELARRKAEHMESAEHIAPQHSYPGMPMHPKRLTEKVLREHFHLPLTEVAKKFGMCTTAFKKLCRKQGIMQWPHRTLRSLEKKIASLRAEQKFTNDHNQIEDQVRKLQQKREAILSGNVAALDGEDILASDDSSASSAGASGRSSPRTADVMGALHLDDSVSSVGSVTSVTSLSDEHKSSGLRHNRSLTDLRNDHQQHMNGAPFGRPGSNSSAEHPDDAEAYRRHVAQHGDLAGGMFRGMLPAGYPMADHMMHPGGMRWWGGPGDARMDAAADAARYGYPAMMRPASFGDPAGPGGVGALRHQVSVLMEENASLRAMLRNISKDREEMVRQHEAAIASAMSEAANYRHMYLQLEAQMHQMQRENGEQAAQNGAQNGTDGEAAQQKPACSADQQEGVKREGGEDQNERPTEGEEVVALHQSYQGQHI